MVSREPRKKSHRSGKSCLHPAALPSAPRNILTICILLFFATSSYYLYRMFMGDCYITLAQEIEKGDERNTAIPAYRKAIEYARGNPEYHFLSGKFYLKFARAANDRGLKETLFKRALNELEQAKKGSTKDAGVYLALAQTSEELSYLTDQTDQTDQYYRTALSLYPNSTQYRYLLARYCKRKGKIGEALRHIKTMISLDPNTNRYIQRNPFWQVTGIDEAVEDGLSEALENRFTRNSAAGLLASRLAAKGEWIEAASLYKQAMPKGAFVDLTPYYLRMGRYLLHGGKEKEAEAYFLRALDVASDRAVRIKHFIRDYKRAGKFDELFGLFEYLKRRYPDLVEIDLYWGQVLYGQKDYPGARSRLDRFLERKETAEADYWMARICERLKEPYAAETYIKRAIKWEPENAGYHHFYAGLLFEEWRFSNALKEADAAILASDGKNPWYLDRKAWILYRMNRYKESIEAWESAAGLRPGHKGFRRNIEMATKAAE